MKFNLHKKVNVIGFLLLFLSVQEAVSQTIVLEKQMVHLRLGDRPEWSNFTDPHQPELKVTFESKQNVNEMTLRLRQEDVRYNWQIQLNGKEIGRLDTDENTMIGYFVLPPGSLKTGQNTLMIEPTDTLVDDIRVGNIVLIDRPLQQVLTQGMVEISVTDGLSGNLLPARITIVDKDGALQPVGIAPDRNLAIRTGCIVTGSGKTSFGLPEGAYTIYANHGFEYGVDSVRVVVQQGKTIGKNLVISREVPTEGWVSCDTHIHTNYYAGDGDATILERAITLAGEGIELPVLTDHNVKSNLDSVARVLGMRKYYTPVVGYEYTTPIGHFNVFPVPIHTPVAGLPINSWDDIVDNLHNTDKPKIIILNHGRDIHKGFRPFDDKLNISSAGVSFRGWKFPPNAMEVINSSAALTDYMSLYRDWFGLMNRGFGLTPIGSSDSHHVFRYLVGQGLTYIKANEDDPGKIDQEQAMENLRNGKVMVGLGLLTEMVVENKYGPGEFVPTTSGDLNVTVRVLGPGWTTADRIVLYANGVKIKEEAIPNGGKAGIKYEKTWKIPRSKYDVFLVAIAEGPGGNNPFWKVPKPYQNTSPVWIPRVIGSTGAVWIDGDGDGIRNSASFYANKLVGSNKNIESLIDKLASYDESVAIQVAANLQEQGQDLSADEVSKALEKATPATKVGFQKFIMEYLLTQNQSRK